MRSDQIFILGKADERSGFPAREFGTLMEHRVYWRGRMAYRAAIAKAKRERTCAIRTGYAKVKVR